MLISYTPCGVKQAGSLQIITKKPLFFRLFNEVFSKNIRQPYFAPRSPDANHESAARITRQAIAWLNFLRSAQKKIEQAIALLYFLWGLGKIL
ncbi:MAG: hypothetical protein HY231_00525 [Acidobacteria bacterium]|nr:hypothetical protein [Acidobacteriota bacterium]